MRTTEGEPDPHICVCIVNWNTRETLRACLTSLCAAENAADLNVVVVDNASTDGSVEMVATHFPRVRLIANSDNVGFATATNQAMRTASTPYYLLLNPDVTGNPSSIRALLRCMQTHPDAGAATGKLLDGSGHFQYYYYRRDFGWSMYVLEIANSLTWNVAPTLTRKLVHPLWGEEDVRRIEMAPGGCLMIRAEVLQSVGMLDEEFFLFHEDDDWCRRIRRAGWHIYYCPHAVFEHPGGTSFQGWTSHHRASQLLLSRLLFLDKHYSKPLMWFGRAALTSNFVVHLCVFIAARVLRPGRKKNGITWRHRLEWIRLVLRNPANLTRRR